MTKANYIEADFIQVALTDFDAVGFYAYPATTTWWRTNFVATLDGAAWSGGGTSGPLGSAVDKRAFTTMRSLADVIVVGAGTARREEYSPITTESVDAALRQRRDLSPAPTLAVVSRSLDIPASLIDGGAVVVTAGGADREKLAALKATTEVMVAGEDAIDWSAVNGEFAERGWQRILCEGGPALHGELLGLGMVDEICLTISPTVAAGEAGRIATSAQQLDQPAALAGVACVDGVLLTRWRPDTTSGRQ